jgi:hypothetical protein
MRTLDAPVISAFFVRRATMSCTIWNPAPPAPTITDSATWPAARNSSELPRAVNESAGQVDPALHASRVRPHLPVGRLLEVEELEELVRSGPGLGP